MRRLGCGLVVGETGVDILFRKRSALSHYRKALPESVAGKRKAMKLSTAAYLLVLAAELLSGLCSPCHAQRISPSKRTALVKAATEDVRATSVRGVQIDLGNEAGGLGFEPLDFLSGALARHPRSRFFRVTWNVIVGSLSSTITALYDRRRETVRYYCCGGHNAAGNRADVIYAHYLYTGVTEQVIRQATEFERSRDQGTASKYGRGPYPDAVRRAPTYAGAGTPGNYYDALLIFGCYRRKLS